MELAIQLYSLRNQVAQEGLDTVLAHVASAGFTCVELAGTYGLSETELNQRLLSHGLRAVSAHISADILFRGMDEALCMQRALGLELIVLPYQSEEEFEDFSSVTERIKKACAAAEKEGLTLVYHNHQHELTFLNDLEALSRAVPSLSFEPDAFWLRVAGYDPAAYIRRFNGKISALHVKELSASGEKAPNPIVGDGITGCAEAICAAFEVGATYAILEAENIAIPYPQYLSECYNRLKDMVEAAKTAASAGEKKMTVADDIQARNDRLNDGRPMRIAVVGYGGMGAYHASRLQGLPYYKVVGTFDTDPVRQTVATADGFKAYPSFEALAADPDIDAVIVATPNDTHAFYCEMFARAGKHVICEKPAAMTAKQYTDMVQWANRMGTVLSVHQNRRWDLDFLTVRNLLKDARLGEVTRIESRVLGANGIPGGWRKTVEQGGGMMLDWGVHLLDQLLLAIPEKLIESRCRLSHAQGFPVDDGFTAELVFESGLTAFVQVDTNCFVSLPRWVLLGRDGSAVIRDWDINGEVISAIYDDSEPVKGITAGNGFTRTMAYRPHSAVKKSDLPIPQADNDAFYRNFYQTACGKEEQAVQHEQVLRVLSLMEKFLTK